MRRTRRRGHGEGAVYQRESDGRWVGSITIGRTAAGRQKRCVVYGRTKAEVMAKLREKQLQHSIGTLADPSSLTVASWLQRWTETVGKAKRATTQERRQVYIAQHINPYLGTLRLGKLALVHLEGWLADMERDGRSDWTRHQAATTLGTSLKRAVRIKLIPFNPAADLVKPKPKGLDREIEILTQEEANRLLAASHGHRLHALYVLELATGLRQGELLALSWAEVDTDAATVKVVRTLKAKKGGGFTLEPPKSKRSRRTIDLPRFAVEAIEEHRRAMLAEGRDVKAGAVFVTRTGNYYGKSNFVRQVHKPLLKRAGLPERTFHALRHAHASALLANGRSIRAVSERLGHSNPELTLRVYCHLLPGDGKETARVLDGMFGGYLASKAPETQPAGV